MSFLHNLKLLLAPQRTDPDFGIWRLMFIPITPGAVLLGMRVEIPEYG
jgi:hypothetical protein